MEILTLNCWIRGTDVGSIVQVKISRTETVAALKKVIKSENPVAFRDVDAVTLHLYKPRNPLPRPYKENLSNITLSEDGELLEMGDDELSEMFPEPAPKRHIHIIIDAPYLMIVCWLRGCTLDASFEISIRASATMSELKDCIREGKSTLRNVDREHIRLYRISGDEDGVQESLSKTGDGNPLHGHTLLPNFLGVPVLDPFYVVAEDTSSTNDRTALPRVGEQDDILTALIESFKRTTTITSKSLTPSQAAKSSEYVKIQSGDRRLLDCRCAASNPVDTVAPPIQLFNPAFAYFSSKAFDPEYNVPGDFILNVRDLMGEFALIHTNEDTRRRHLKSFLEKAIRHPLVSAGNSDKTAPDIMALSSCGELPVYLIVGEEKNEFGDGGSDPSVQAAFSFLRVLSQKENSELCLRCCCPTFIIAHAGPWLTIMGGIITANCVVQRLTDFLWVPAHSTHDDNQCHRIARILYALRESIQCLDSWYKTIEDAIPFNPLAPAIHPRFFPSPNTYRHDSVPVKFAYQKPLERNVSCVTYLAKTIEDNSKDIVVKFVTSYGVDAHRKMASAGFAPQLLYYGSIDVTPDMPSYGNLRMVVMEYVEGLTFEDALKQRKVPSRFEDDLRQAFKQLHSAGHVFGDLRQPNVIVTPERPSTVQLIDFDWAGKEGEVKYPVSISRSISWPEGVHGLASIQKEHDLAMLNSLMHHWSQC